MGSRRRLQPLASARFPAAVSSFSGTGSGAQSRRCPRVPRHARGAQGPSELLSQKAGTSGQSRPQLSGTGGAGRLLPDAIPMRWPVATLCHLWVPWKHLDRVRLGQATPVGCFWGAAEGAALPVVPVPGTVSVRPRPAGDREEWRVL